MRFGPGLEFLSTSYSVQAGKYDYFWGRRLHPVDHGVKPSRHSRREIFVLVVVEEYVRIQVGPVQNCQDLGCAVNVYPAVRPEQIRDRTELARLLRQSVVASKPQSDDICYSEQ